MKTKIWAAILVILLVVCGGLGMIFLQPGENSDYAQILSHGEVVKTVNLHMDQEFTVTTDDGGYNIVTVKDGAIAVSEASCPDHYCQDRGFCSGGVDIVCLPNKLVIRFLGQQDVDSAVG